MASSVGLSFAQKHLPELLERGEELLIEREKPKVVNLVAVLNAEPSRKPAYRKPAVVVCLGPNTFSGR